MLELKYKQMSIASYNRNRKKRVTGPNTYTCYPAALEQVSPHNGLPPKAYKEYESFYKWYSSLSLDGRIDAVEDFESIVGNFAYHLGRVAFEDVVFKRVNTALSLKRVVNKLIGDDYRVVLEVDFGRDVHAVGLLPLPETGYYSLVSTYLPKTLQGIVTLDHIAKRIHRDPDPYISGHPINNANITALPPAA